MRLKLINKFFCLSNIPKKCWRGAFIVQTESTCDVYLLSSHLLHVDERKSLLRKERFFRCAWITAACLPSTHIFLLFSLVFIMMVCYFYIFQRFNLQLFLLLTLILRFRFISYRCRCRRIQKGSIFSVSFLFFVPFLL